MADEKVYREVYVRVGFGIYTSGFTTGNFVEVQTENEITKLIISFPAAYSDYDYAKFIDVCYTGSDAVTRTESYALGSEVISGTSYSTFILPRRFTYGSTALIQFRAKYTHEAVVEKQEIVDPEILTIRFKRALKTSGFTDMDNLPEPIYSEVMAFILANAASGWSGWTGWSGWSGMPGEYSSSGFTDILVGVDGQDGLESVVGLDKVDRLDGRDNLEYLVGVVKVENLDSLGGLGGLVFLVSMQLLDTVDGLDGRDRLGNLG
jgi:hypothetical protein